ncbi:hypothetical protein [Pisciglobus halotolerans]|uniref:Uncharacterized protein n=1 Tax=Pisciglobus halotolerans TaxID=745365 RepID=A0A1I3CW60_9LACT|nr:hypothetical protein [Pisciglobus halotolerans]SFH78673.1 hypothetical protein SAMN04489868_12414 [Pisciglobus halotolerans]
MNEEGGIFPSMIVFISLTLLVVFGTVSIYRSQMYQLRLTKQAYLANSMLVLTEDALEKQLESGKTVKEAKANFEKGVVSIHKISEDTYQLQATEANGFTKKKTVECSASLQKETPEQNEMTNKSVKDQQEQIIESEPMNKIDGEKNESAQENIKEETIEIEHPNEEKEPAEENNR